MKSCCAVSPKVKPKILFVLKKRDICWGDSNNYSYGGFSSGLFNSATFVKDMLLRNGLEAKLVEVIDGDFVDKEVYNYQPTHVVIEALFCTPTKIKELSRLYPKIKWIIRNHSDTPFLSTEGIGFDWLLSYPANFNVVISNNKENINADFRFLLKEVYPKFQEDYIDKKVVFLPNYYPVSKYKKSFVDKPYINIACFGAIRSLKNPVIQAIAALEFADKIGKKLHFHINGGRVENQGDQCKKSLDSIFDKIKGSGHELISHDWLSHDKFLLLCDDMDIGMQLSFSESMNIVTSDLTNVQVPVVVSSEIFWVHSIFQANPTDTSDIVAKLSLAWKLRKITNILNVNKRGLRKYSENSEKIWLKYLYSTV